MAGLPWATRIGAFFRRYPILFLLALTPGIPEYLSGSTSSAVLVLDPLGFLLFLLLNLGLYGAGVLLIREAIVRWRKGWAAVLLLGASYGLLEEGSALSTLFNPRASVVSSLGVYGHADGVNWVWVIGVLQIHIVLSVGLPIVLLGLALPGTRGRPLLTKNGIVVAAVAYVLTILALAAAVHYPAGAPLIVFAAVVALLLILLARLLPAPLLDPPSDRPRISPTVAVLLGLLFFPLLLLVPALGEHAHWWAPVTGVVEIAACGGLFFAVRWGIGRRENEALLARLAFGTLLPIAFIGVLAQIDLPVVLLADLLFAWFFVTLFRIYPTIPALRSGPVPPPGA